MIPGELIVDGGEIELNAGRPTLTLAVANTGDRPIQVGSHFHFYEVNDALQFDREQTRGMRLDIPAGTAVRFEPRMRASRVRRSRRAIPLCRASTPFANRSIPLAISARNCRNVSSMRSRP